MPIGSIKALVIGYYKITYDKFQCQLVQLKLKKPPRVASALEGSNANWFN